jgi:hypothetical protein
LVGKWRGWRLPATLAVGLLVIVGGLSAANVMSDVAAPLVYREHPAVEAFLNAPNGAARSIAAGDHTAQTGPSRIDAPRVAIVVVGLGLAEASTRASIELPAAVGLAFSPYGADAIEWQRKARQAGHEILVELPLEPLDSARSDAGPRALTVDGEPSAKLEGLEWVLGRSVAPSGLVAAPGRFATQTEAFAPVAQMLADRRLGLIELGSEHLANVASAVGMAHASAVGPLDRELLPEAIDAALGSLEGAARHTGQAVAFAHPYPVTLARIAAWAESLGDRGLALVPPSRALLVETSKGAGSE